MLSLRSSQGTCPTTRRGTLRGLPRPTRSLVRGSSNESRSEAETSTSTSASSPNLEKDLNRIARQTAGTFAPRSSTVTKNPATKGSVLYWIFEVQAWVALVVGGLLSFNLIYPTDEPSIARLMGMWSIWMFTIPSLRAKECTPTEKDALNYLFLGVPVMNVLIPFVSKSFPLIFLANTAAVVGMYAYKGVWREIYGIPLGALPKDYPPKEEAPSS